MSPSARWRFAGCGGCIAGAAAAAGGGLFFERSVLLLVERFGDRVALGVHAGEQLDLPLDALEQMVTRFQVFHALFVAGECIGETQLAALQLVDDRLELGERLFERRRGRQSTSAGFFLATVQNPSVNSFFERARSLRRRLVTCAVCEAGRDRLPDAQLASGADHGAGLCVLSDAIAALQHRQRAERLQFAGKVGEAALAIVQQSRRPAAPRRASSSSRRLRSWTMSNGRRNGRCDARPSSRERASVSWRRLATRNRDRYCVSRATSSSAAGTTRSAASLGVRARTSAARSASVTSISWPTAETVGIRDAAIARTTASSLNDHRSSRLPPPRPTTSTSGAGSSRLAARMPATISAAAPSPWTRAGMISTSTPRQRRRSTSRKSRTAAPVGLVTKASRRGKGGSRRLRAGSNKPFGRELLAELAQRELQRADALGLDFVDDKLVAAARRVDVEMAAAEDFEPVGQFELELRRGAAPHHGPDLRRGRL